MIGVEPELAADARESLARGPDRRAGPRSRSAGRSPTGPGPSRSARRTFAHLLRPARRRSSPSPRPRSRRAVRLAAEEARLVVEPSGALSIAALRFRAAEAGLDGLTRPDRGGGQRRQRRPGALPRAARLRNAGPARDRRRHHALPRSPASRAARRSSRSRIAARSRRQPGLVGLSLRAPRAASRPRRSARIAVMNTTSPPSHMIPPASCWSASGVGPHGPGRASRSAGRAAPSRCRSPARGTCSGASAGRCRGSGPGSGIRHGPGRRRRPATRTAAPTPRYSRRAPAGGPAGSRATTSNSGEKWRPPHAPPRTRARSTTGKRRSPRTREWSTGRIQRRRISGGATRRSRVIGAPSSEQRRGHERQQQVLDHVDREQRRVVALDPATGARPRSRAGRPARTRSVRAAARDCRDGPRRPRGPPTGSRPRASARGSTIERIERPAGAGLEQGRRRRRAAAVGRDRHGGHEPAPARRAPSREQPRASYAVASGGRAARRDRGISHGPEFCT